MRAPLNEGSLASGRPAVNSSPAVVDALSWAELSVMQPVFERDFSRLLSVLIAVSGDADDPVEPNCYVTAATHWS